jgi:bis(5'-nucleosidyl)-tetraphosphatase
MKNLVSAGIIVYRLVDKTMEFLVLKYGAGHWDFSKGHVEEGETLRQAALRELQEEAGIQARIDEEFEQEFSYIFHDYDGVLAKKKVYFFVGHALSDEVHLSYEHTDFAWLPYTAAYEKLTYENAKNLLKQAHLFLRKDIDDIN